MNSTSVVAVRDSEIALVGAICQGHDVPEVDTEWFVDEERRAIYKACRDLKATDSPVNSEIVRNVLEHFGSVVSTKLLEDSFQVPVSGLYLEHYAETIRIAHLNARELSIKRDLQDAASRGAFGRAMALADELRLLNDGQVRTIQRFGGKAASDLWDSANESVEWLVQDVISCDQPTIFGAKQKTLKTTLVNDLAVSLSTGLPWLNRFEIPRKQRILMIVGEASEKAAIRKIRKAAEIRNVTREEIGDSIRVETKDFPALPSEADCQAVQRSIQENDISVVILDPLYMGLEGVSTTNLTEVGPAMRRFMQHCRPANVIIVHHVKKTAGYDDAPNLEDLSQAGIGEFAGNFWLMGRMSEYLGDGMHDLAIRYGGRDEQFGLLKLKFDERNWTADFTNLIDHRAFQEQSKENEKVGDMKRRILKALERNPGGMSESKLAEAAGTKAVRNVFQTAIEELEASSTIESMPDFKSGNRTSLGFKIVA